MNPKAFISYSHDSEDLKAWVRVFADRLQSEGVEVTLDQYDLHLGETTPYFMERGVADNDFVLLFVTKGYVDKATARKGGVGFETDLVTGEIIVSNNRRKFIPIVVKIAFEDLPPFLKGANAVVIKDLLHYEKEYEQLYRTLTGQEHKKPPLGPIRVLPSTANAVAPFDVPSLSAAKKTPNFCYWDIRISSISLQGMTLPQLFPLYRAYCLQKQISGPPRTYPFILDPRNKKSHHPEIVYESGDYSGISNVASYDKIAFLDHQIRYSYIDLTDDNAFGISPRWVEGSLIALLRIVENVHVELKIQPNVEVAVHIHASKPVAYLESRSMFDFKKGVMDSYYLMDLDTRLQHTMATFEITEYESLFQKVFGSFVSDQPRSTTPYLLAQNFRMIFGRLLNTPDFY